MTYKSIWRQAIWNYVFGMFISIVPGFAFYSLAFEYTPEQLSILAWLALPGVVTILGVDLLVLRGVLAPVRRALEDGAGRGTAQRGIDRLLDLPVLVLLRIFGPHAVSGTLAFNLLVVWANRAHGLGIPESHFALYWLLNLTVIPVGHAVFEYHATERLIQAPLAELLRRGGGTVEPERLVRFPLAARIFLFSTLLGMTPPVIGGFVAYQRTQAAGLELPAQFLFNLAVVAVALTLLWVLLLALVSREIGEQTSAITKVLDRIAGGDLRAEAPIQSTSEFGKISLAVNEMAAGLRERQKIRDMFGAYLTRDLADELLQSGRLATTERREVCVMFVDLRDFTALSAQQTPEQVVELLNEFFRVAVAAVVAERGHVNKFLGDGLLAVFGAPVALDDAADCALRAAIQIRTRLGELNERFAARQLPQLKMGAGIHAGEVIVGTIGSPEQKLEYTVIGETVNLASRVEGLNKEFGTEILMTRETAKWLKGSYPLEALPAAEVKGVARKVELVRWAGEKSRE